jgi:hypothetical protein
VFAGISPRENDQFCAGGRAVGGCKSLSSDARRRRPVAVTGGTVAPSLMRHLRDSIQADPAIQLDGYVTG